MIVNAPAKINLCLHVTGQRADGYHTLESLVTFADVGDALHFSPASIDRFDITGPFSGALSQDDAANLVLRARDLLRKAAYPAPCPPVAIQLVKNLPLASGIGGGSADAAATLNGLNAFWQLGISLEQLAHIGLALGADVPMCVHGVPLIASGIGEITHAVNLPLVHLLLVNPRVGVSTPLIFKALTQKANQGLPVISSFNEPAGEKKPAMQLEDLLIFLRNTRNDLQSPAIVLAPIIGDVLNALEKSGAVFARMSGSGATCFGVFSDHESKKAARSKLATLHPDWWLG